MKYQLLFSLAITGLIPLQLVQAETISLNTRTRRETVPKNGHYVAESTKVQWEASQTAVIVCDMWDKHWCPNATARVAELAPRMNEVLKTLRGRGAMIIHCPSSTLDFYKDHPARKRAQSAPPVEPKVPLENWCRLKPEKEPALPIDDSDGGCDCDEPVKNYQAWTRQIATIEISDNDAITDSAEAYYLMRQLGIKHVIVMGVHTNMCVLGRPFAVRQLSAQGLDVVLMRDMTDTMYNPAKKPFVSHFTGTDLVVQHIEKYWCPSVISGDVLDGKEFRFSQDKRPTLLALSAEEEYRTSDTLPEFSVNDLGDQFRTEIALEDPANKGRLAGFDANIDQADVLLVSVRRRPLVKGQLDKIRKYVAAGKPIVGIRTASHPFHLNGKPTPDGLADWPDFDKTVIGGNYQFHHPNATKTMVWIDPQQKNHPILHGIEEGEFSSGGTLYKNHPLPAASKPIAFGKASGVDQVEPIAWTFLRADGGRTFYTSLGHFEDFRQLRSRQLLRNGICWAANLEPAAKTLQADAILRMPVPGVWETVGPESVRNYDGFAWYRCSVKIPEKWVGRGIQIYVESVDNACETFINGVKVGVSGQFPPNYASGLAANQHRYVIPPDVIKPNQNAIVAIRVFDHDGAGGFKGIAPVVVLGNEGISLKGDWEFRTGDDLAFAKGNVALPAFETVAPAPKFSPFATVIQRTVQDQPYSPRGSMDLMKIPDDLELDLVLAEPEITQPLFMNFDERGRMWVMEYRQYPEPAGVKVLSKDRWWRAVYDKVPLPPPAGDKGIDRISIHEDTNGDGKYDKHSVFVDDLNIATSFAQGRGGVWVLNPPYLLYYADKNHDDRPDGPPEVLLEGFGLEDTHSVVNSLRFGPDGWLYGAQGSTVSGSVRKPGSKEKGVFTQGQNIWRYHPVTKKYEVFAEGGGNAFGIELDRTGEIFSGHNGGDTRGFHYVQGGYLQKGFGKHGPLSNPYAFGYFPAMEHPKVPRFSHTFLVYEGNALPEKYQGEIFAVVPLLSHVVLSQRERIGTTFRTKDVGYAIESSDTWFKPVDVKEGSDGYVYVADWYDGQLAHTANYQGGLDRERGRIYRLRGKGQGFSKPMDLGSLDSKALIDLLPKVTRTVRQQIIRVLWDRGPNPALVEPLANLLAKSEGQTAIEVLWSLNAVGGLDEQRALAILGHSEGAVRAWTVRVLADEGTISSAALGDRLVQLAKSEYDVVVCSQLAASARRLPHDLSIRLLTALASRDEFVADSRLPLQIWWVWERLCTENPKLALSVLEDARFWNSKLAKENLLARVMRRFASASDRSQLKICAELFEKAPSPDHIKLLMAGFEQAFQGRSMQNLPPELVAALARHAAASPSLKIRSKDPAAVAEALQNISDEKLAADVRRERIMLLGEIGAPGLAQALLPILETTKDDGIRAAALQVLPISTDERIPGKVLSLYGSWNDDLRDLALTALTTREPWSLALVEKIESGAIRKESIPLDFARQMSLFRSPLLKGKVEKLWGQLEGGTSEEMRQEIARYETILTGGDGNPYPGKASFMQVCGKCHRLHGTGGDIGPDLTSFKRDDVRHLLANVVNPSLEIREGFETMVVETKDGRVLTGFIADSDPQVLVLRQPTGQTVSIPRDEVDEQHRIRRSIMPEGALKTFTEQQIRDLFAYLRSTQPIPE